MLLEQFGGDGFADNTDINTRTGFVLTGGALALQSRFGVAGEKWINPSTFITRSTAVQVQAPESRRQLEYSFSMYAGSNYSGGAITLFTLRSDGAEIMRVDSASAISGDTMSLRLHGGTNGLLDDLFSNTDVDTTNLFSKVFEMQAGGLYYVTLRMKAETTSSSNDCEVEMYINGEKIFHARNFPWISTSGTTTWSTAPQLFEVDATNGTHDMEYKNFSVHDEWTTADDVPPTYKYVLDMEPVAVTAGANYTNTGGAATPLAALIDDSDTTYLETTTGAEEVQCDFTVDPILATREVVEVQTKVRAARQSGTLNVLDVQLRTAADDATHDSSTFNLAALAPAREEVQVTLTPPAATLANDISLKVVNGS